MVCFQLLNLLDVIIDSAGNKSSEKSLIDTILASGPQISVVEPDVNADSNILSSGDDASTNVEGSSKPTSSGQNVECDSHGVLSNLRKAELRLLCSLLAQEGYVLGLCLLSTYLLFVYLFSKTRSFCVSESRGVGVVKLVTYKCQSTLKLISFIDCAFSGIFVCNATFEIITNQSF